MPTSEDGESLRSGIVNVLLISNMYPSEQKPYAGIFVKNQYEHLRSLVKDGDRIDIFYMKRKFTSAFGSFLKYIHAAVRFVPRCLRHYDVIHVHFFYPLYALAFLYKLIHPRAKIIVTFHGGDTVKGRMHRTLFSLLAKKGDFTIAVGRQLAGQIRATLGLTVDRILCAGVDKNIFYKMDGVEKEYDVLFAGSFYSVKGVDVLLDAVKKLSDRTIRLCFAGSGPYYSEIVELSKMYNITIKVDQTQEQLRNLYNKSKFIIQPSRQEGFGLVVTEALYCGTPAIVANTGGLTDQVIDGANGFVLTSNTAEGIQCAITAALSTKEGEYGRLSSNAEKSNAQFSLQTVCYELMEIYRGMVNSR